SIAMRASQRATGVKVSQIFTPYEPAIHTCCWRSRSLPCPTATAEPKQEGWQGSTQSRLRVDYPGPAETALPREQPKHPGQGTTQITSMQQISELPRPETCKMLQ
uniref:Uncharacterized protein n=1 Tax=Electrophorus electricus TaxID=8005 RepID=A0AAY5F5M7_ELEEL